jgi:hypothetical protein
MREIRQAIPDALFVHIVRDGRDVALSLDKLGWSRPLPWDRNGGLVAAALQWQWMLRKGRGSAPALGGDYTEVRFEDLVRSPQETLATLGRFLDHDLDYERIREVAIGAVRTPSSSFGDWGRRHASRAASTASAEVTSSASAGRWKEALTREQLAALESRIGDTLEQCGYQRATTARRKADRVYPLVYEVKHWLKTHTRVSSLFYRYSEVLIDK